METTNTFATPETKQSFWARFDVNRKKVDRIVEKTRTVCDKITKLFLIVCKHFSIFVNNLLNLAVKLSIIVIALLMIQNFAKANPVEWTNCIANVVDTFNNCKNYVVEPINNVLEMFSLFR